MRIFLSVLYSSQVDAAGNVFAAYRSDLEEVIAAFEVQGHHVFCAPREDGWKLNNISPTEAFELDVKHIDECDVFIAFVERAVSAGIQLELGIAYAKGKRIVLVSSEPLAYINQGLLESGASFVGSGSSQAELVGNMKDLAAELAG